MAAAMASTEFDSWLTKKLLNMNPDTDLEVFVQYIKSILETEDDAEEQKESIVDLLGQITEDNLESHCNEIISQYTDAAKSNVKDEKKGADAFGDQFKCALEKQNAQIVRTQAKPLTKDDLDRRRAKEAILQQFGEVSSGEDDNDDDAEGETAEGLSANMNSKLVIQRQVAEREKNKQDHERKKQKDKEDREKQKQKALDRKEAEKKRTQKGEKRR